MWLVYKRYQKVQKKMLTIITFPVIFFSPGKNVFGTYLSGSVLFTFFNKRVNTHIVL